MAGIKTSISLEDGVSPKLSKILQRFDLLEGAVTQNAQRFAELEKAVKSCINENLKLKSSVTLLPTKLEKAILQQNRITKSTNQANAAQQKVKTEVAKTALNQQRTRTEAQRTSTEVARTALTQQKVTNETAKTVLNQERAKNEVVKTALNQEKVKNEVVKTALNQQKVKTEVVRTNNEQLKGRNIISRGLKILAQRLNILQKTKTEVQRTVNEQRKGLLVDQRRNTEKKRGELLTFKILNLKKKIEQQTIRNKQAQDKYNNSVSRAVTTHNQVWSALRRGTTAYLSLQSAGGILGASDSLTMVKARLELMNDGLETTAELQTKIYESAMRSRSSYFDMAQAISKVAMQAGSLFKSGGKQNNAAIVQFMENYNKMAAISGATTQQTSAAMLQIIQSLSSGELRGDELRSVLENMPVVADYLAQKMGVARDQILELGHDGKISAEILRDAILGATDDLNEKIKKMPYTWGQVWVMFKNFAVMSFEPLLNAINAIIKNKKFQNVAAVFGNLIGHLSGQLHKLFNYVLSALGWVYDKAVKVIQWVKNNWASVSSVITTVVASFLWLRATIVSVGKAIGEWIVNKVEEIRNSHDQITNELNNKWNSVKDVLQQVNDTLASFGDWVSDNSGWMVSSILAIAGAFGLVALAIGAVTAITWLATAAQAAWGAVVVAWTAIKSAACAVMAFYTGLTFAQAVALTNLAAAEWLANLPLIAKIILIGLIIAAVVWLIAKFLEWIDVSENTGAAVCGIFAWIVAVIIDAVLIVWNCLIAVWNGILAFFDSILNKIIGAVEWWLNVFGGGFDSFGDAVANLLGNIISWFLDLGAVVTRIIDAIFGTNWTAGLNSLKNKVLQWGKNEMSITLDRDVLQDKFAGDRVEYLNPNDWYRQTYDAVDGLGDTLSGLKDSITTKASEYKGKLEEKLKGVGDKLNNGIKSFTDSAAKKVEDATKKISKLGEENDLEKALNNGFGASNAYNGNPVLDQIAKSASDTANNTADTAKNTDTSDEDFKYLRQLAERESMNRSQLMNFKVDMSNVNHIKSGLDVDEVMKRLAKELYYEVISKMEGVY